MECTQTHNCLTDDPCAKYCGNRALGNERFERPPFDEFGDDVGTRLRIAVFENVHDVIAVDSRKRIRLSLEPLHQIDVIRPLAPENLHHDGSVRRLVVTF